MTDRLSLIPALLGQAGRLGLLLLGLPGLWIDKSPQLMNRHSKETVSPLLQRLNVLSNLTSDDMTPYIRDSRTIAFATLVNTFVTAETVK